MKLITTGEGGLATTNDPDLAARMARLRSHGISRDPAEMLGRIQGELEGPWYYQQLELGFNCRLTDIQAALGHSQLQRLDDYVARRQHLATRYDRMLAALPLRLPFRDPAHRSALHLYPVQVPGDRRRVFDALRQAGIGVNVHYIPVHTQPDYARFGFQSGDFPVAEAYYERAISLPLYPLLTEVEQDQVVAALRDALT